MKHILVILVTALVSCSTPKKLNKLMDKLPEATAKECSQRFPILETTDTITVIDTSLIKAYEMEFGYLYYVIDSLLGKQVSDSTKKQIITIFQDKKVPVIKYKYITKTQESSAKVQVIWDSCQKMSTLLHKKLDITTKELTASKDKCHKSRNQRNSLLWIVILLSLWILRKPILRLVKPI